MAFTHVCTKGDWKFKGEPANGPKIDEQVTVLYDCYNTQGTASYSLKEYPGFCFAKHFFKPLNND